MTCEIALKILYLTPGCFDKGGISRYCRYQIAALREIAGEGSVRPLSLLGPDPDGFETPFEVSWHGKSGTATWGDRVGFSVQAARQALLWKPDAILCAHVNLAPLATRLAKLCGARTLLNVYGLELWSGLSPSRRLHMARIDHVISDCHATADHVSSQAMHPREPTVIWDCADLDRFQPGPPPPRLCARYGLPDLEHHRVVLTLGRLAVAARHKGYDRLLDIWSSVCSRVPQARLVVAGRGDDADRLQQKTAMLGLESSVTFTGAIDEEDLAAIYRAAHVFALVSDKGPGRGEGIPLTPIEAMASGLPVLVGDEDGSREAVDGTRNGFVVSPRDEAGMTDALVHLLTEPVEAHVARAVEARRVAEERFGYPAFVQKHRMLFEQIFGKD